MVGQQEISTTDALSFRGSADLTQDARLNPKRGSNLDVLRLFDWLSNSAGKDLTTQNVLRWVTMTVGGIARLVIFTAAFWAAKWLDRRRRTQRGECSPTKLLRLGSWLSLLWEGLWHFCILAREVQAAGSVARGMINPHQLNERVIGIVGIQDDCSIEIAPRPP
jgi:hypothetical protein